MPTTNPVPSTDPSDLLFNAGKLDEIVNGTANSFTDRLGATRRTVAGMNADFDAQLADAESDLNVYRADAAASAAEALGYLQTIRATSYGAYASDPATDPLGNPPTVGDEYFNTTANLLKRWNGTTWQASDINTANLAASSGASLVGYDGGTVQDVLDGAKSLQDYAALRAYAGRANRIYITGLLVMTNPDGITGTFQYDPTDTTSADNGGTIVIDANGRRWKRDFDGAFNILWFNADRTGNVSSSGAIQSTINAIETRGIGGSIHAPSGTYNIDTPVNFYLSNIKNIKIFGDGMNATQFKWTGGAGRALTNEKPVSSTLYFQYGVFFEDLSIVGDGVTGFNPTPGSVGIHIEKAQNHWQLSRVRIDRFATGLDIGVHSEGGQLLKSVFGYNDVGVNAYGDQSDALVIDACWFIQNRVRGLILSSPRPVVTGCWFGGRVGASGYADIQIGYQATRAEDIGKSTYLVAGTGNAAIKARISKNSFEYFSAGSPQILFQNADTTTKVFDGYSIERNYFASYDSPAPIKIIDTFENVAFNKNNHASTIGAPFIDCQNDVMGQINIEEPFIAKLFASDDQSWKFEPKTEGQFNQLLPIANIAGFGNWSWRTISSTYMTVDVDHDGLNSVKISNAVNTPAASSVDIINTTCPAGMTYFNFGIGQATTEIIVDLNVFNASGQVIYSKRNIQITNAGLKNIAFGFNNPTLQTVYLRFSLRSAVAAAGSFIVKEPKIKHADGSVNCFGLIDTATGSRFTNRNNQIHSFYGRLPYAQVFDYANPATGGWTVGRQVKTTVATAAASGSTTLDVSDATNIAAGDFIYLKPNIATGVIGGHIGSITTGNKVSSKAGNTLTLATGIPFAVDAGNSVIAQTVYTLAARTKV